MPGETGEQIAAPPADTEEIVFEGSSDHTSRFRLGKYARTIGMVFIVGIAAACNRLTPEQMVQQGATQAAQNPETAALVSDAIALHTVRLEKVSPQSVTMSGVTTTNDQGMGVILNEKKNPDGTVTDTIATVDHVLFNGSQLARLIVQNVWGRWLPKFIDDSLPAGIDWSIVSIPKPDENPAINDGITVFSISHPDASDMLTQGTTIEVNTTPMNEGDEIFFTQSIGATNYNPYITTSTIESVVVDKDGHTVYLAKTPSLPGDSGTPVFNKDKQLIGFLYGSPSNYPYDTVIIPMTDQAFKEAFRGQ